MKLQLGWGDLAAGALACLSGGEREQLVSQTEAYWPGETSLLCFSVRSGFDLLLQALELQPNDEVIFSALNIKGMIGIVNREGYLPIPLDIDKASISPSLETLKRAITPRSKILVLAHLFGCRLKFDGLIDAAHEAGLIVVEDCAQAFNGRDYPGHPKADVVMFSFGPLKNATALGGGLLNVRDAALREKMRGIQAGYPVQPTGKQAKRIFQFAGLKLFAMPSVLGLMHRFFSATGRDFEDSVSERVRNVAKFKKAKNLRVQPSTALVALLSRRLARFDPQSLQRRAAKGQRLKGLLDGSMELPGQANAYHDYWVFPTVVNTPGNFIAKLRRHGFDAANLPLNQAVSAPEDRPQLEPRTAADLLAKLVILPCYDGLPDRELQRLANLVRDAAADPTLAASLNVSGLAEEGV
ncbi:MAG: aminotransferase class V-fold PLP-dependent enzyme [Kiloniellaceae bacterium]